MPRLVKSLNLVFLIFSIILLVFSIALYYEGNDIFSDSFISEIRGAFSESCQDSALIGTTTIYLPYNFKEIPNLPDYENPGMYGVNGMHKINSVSFIISAVYYKEINDNFTSKMHESNMNIYDYRDFNPIVGTIIIDGEKNYLTFDHGKHIPHIGVLFIAEIFNSDKNISFMVSGPNLTIELFIDILRLYIYNSRSIDYVLETDITIE